MLELPRNRDGSEALRLQFCRGRADGREVCWHSLRVFWKDDVGEWHPGKQGITLRGKELRPIVEALQGALSGGR